MMGFCYEEIVKRICEEKSLTDQEVQSRVQQKLNALSGLISKEGAAHIVANELGVDLISSMKKHGIKISNINPGMRNVTIVGKVVKDYGIRAYQKEGRDGQVGSFLVGDDSGLIRVVVWDTSIIQQMKANNFSESNIVRVSDGFVKENNGYKEMHLGSRSVLEINPKGVKVSKVVAETKQSFMKKKIFELEVGGFSEIAGTAVQIFEPRHYIGCPECGKKLDNGCKEHGTVAGVNVPIVNFYLDDGTGNVMIVVFRDAVGKLLGVDNEQLLNLEKDPKLFEDAKRNFLGKQIKVGGRVQRNLMFDRLEIVANSIEDVDPDKLAEELSKDNYLNDGVSEST